MRRDIQALRGIAVLLVLLYHFKLGPFHGGFLGVDIFFVISGYVITERITRGTGTIGAQLHDFYLRRARRILPMSLITLVVTSVLARFFLAPISLDRFFHDALAGFALIPNIHFAAQQNNYLNQSLDPSPYLHYWSLGVEEQFYFLWPLIFIFFFRRHLRKVWVMALFGAIFAMWYTLHFPIQSFYLPISRAWEFLIGAALVGVNSTQLSKRLRYSMAIFGWIVMLISAVKISTDFATPGWSTLIPTLATGLVIWAAMPVSEKLFLPKLGDVSYSLYLIHWPVIIIALAQFPLLNKGYRAWLLVAAIILSFLTTNFVEKPIRFSPRFKLKLWQWLVAILVGAGLSALALGTAAANYAHQSKAFTISIDSPKIYSNGCHLEFGKATPNLNCIFGNPKSSTTVILAGDSHAAQWFPAMELLAKTNNWRLLSITKSSCPATFFLTTRNGVLDKSCQSWQKTLSATINSQKPKLVLLSDFTEFQYPTVKGNGDYEQRWGSGLKEFISSIKNSGARIAFLEDTPHPGVDIASCLSAHLTDPQRCDFSLSRTATTQTSVGVMSSMSVYVVNPQSWLCSHQVCPAIQNRVNSYRDSSHISVPAAERMASQLGHDLLLALGSN
jgi:peptidoglycan/LPS O-acetylase OafA/YrhL